jgi:formylglycine-generating enzyme required for sulfatase activity
VSWNDAMAFCRWLSQKSGKSITLPTEAQAEYTCRAGSTTAYYWGEEPVSAASKANVADQRWKSRFPERQNSGSGDDGYLFTAPVGSFPPNPWGLYERIGNANEWCLSLEKPYPYRETDGRNDPEVNARRGWKGGSNFDPAESFRSARRHFKPQANSSSYGGFRVVLLSE